MSKRIKSIEEKINMKKPEYTYPVFCFKYLIPHSYNNCKNPTFFIDFIERLKKLGELGWKEIDKSSRHSFGYEKLPIDKLKINSLPSIVTNDVKELTVFRANGNKLPFLGIRIRDVFQVIYIETEFRDVYDHQ